MNDRAPDAEQQKTTKKRRKRSYRRRINPAKRFLVTANSRGVVRITGDVTVKELPEDVA